MLPYLRPRSSFARMRASPSLVRAAGVTLALHAVLACGDAADDSGRAMDELGNSMEDAGAEPGIEVKDDHASFRTEVFTLEPGSEKYLCYAADVPEDLVIDGFSHEGAPFVHHLLFSRSSGEPEGMSECDVLFRYTWEPIFAAGAGASELELPEDTGHRIAGGQQLVMQMHLFNTTEERVTASVALKMHRSSAEDPETIGNKTFGSFDLSIPPLQQSEVEALCVIDEPVEILAVFPHMHQLGTSLTFEVGSSEDSMEMVYARDPYEFDDQHIEPFELSLEPGDMTRLRCRYDNPDDRTIGFGESTTDEMCLLMGFTRGEHGIGGCTLKGMDSGFVPASCEEVEPNERGIGTSCTKDGDECPDGLRCTAGLGGSEEDSGTCIAIGCESSEECGGGGVTCCAPELTGGSIKVCMPEACRPDNCAPVE